MAKPKKWRVGAERELAKKFWQLGYVVCRCPASGGSRRSYPCLDLFVWDPRTGRLWAVEVKTTAKSDADSRYALSLLSKEEKEKMRELMARGVRVALALKKNGKWKLWELGEDFNLVRELGGERPL